jgi:hypothetical protein
MLSNISRLLTYLTALLSALTGAVLFFAPEQMAAVFAWKVTPFMVMTIGGWCLGNAWLALLVARYWDWTLNHASAMYLWMFGLFETAVLIAFRDKLALGHWIAWLYLAMLAANLITAVWGIIDWLRLRPVIRPARERTSATISVLNLLFIIFVGFLAAYGLLARVGAPGTNGGIFPEIMSPFTLRSFAAFYLALALSTVPVLLRRDVDQILLYSVAAYGLIVFITGAIVAYGRLFNFATAPGGLAYIGAYVVVGLLIAIVLYLKRSALREVLSGRQAVG